MPFGKYITEDSDENFNANNLNNCINDSLHSIASQVFDPLKQVYFHFQVFFFYCTIIFKIIIMIEMDFFND